MQESHRAAMLLLDLTARWIIRLCMIQAAEMIKSSVSSGRLTLYESLFSSAIQKKNLKIVTLPLARQCHCLFCLFATIWFISHVVNI